MINTLKDLIDLAYQQNPRETDYLVQKLMRDWNLNIKKYQNYFPDQLFDDIDDGSDKLQNHLSRIKG